MRQLHNSIKAIRSPIENYLEMFTFDFRIFEVFQIDWFVLMACQLI